VIQRRLLLRKIGLAGGALLCLALLLEVAARLLLPPARYHDAPLHYDPLLGFRGIPDLRVERFDEEGAYPFELNQEGFRGRSLPLGPAREGTLRIAFLGDSFLVGEAVRAEALLTSRLEVDLEARGFDAEVYNLSAVDYGTTQQLMLLDEYGPRIQPDVVVLAFFTGNDVINNALELAGRSIVSRGDPLRPYFVEGTGESRVHYQQPLLAALRARSRLVAEIELRLLTLGERYRIDWLWRGPAGPRVIERLRAGLAPREAYEVFRSHDPGHRWESAWRTTFELLRAFRDRSRALGARPLVLVIPSQDQVIRSPYVLRLDVQARQITGRGVDELLDWNRPERRLAAFLSEQEIDSLFLLPELRAAAAAGGWPYAVDEHFSPEGHQIAAAQVADWLSEAAEAGGRLPDFRGRPLSRFPPARPEFARLDFRDSEHREQLGHGWIRWIPESDAEGENWGWWTGARAMAVLAAGPGDLVVRGSVPATAALPVRGAIQAVGGSRQPFVIERHGPFELRVRARAGGWPLSSEGYVAVGISQTTGQTMNGIPVGLLVREIAFEKDPRTAPAS